MKEKRSSATIAGAGKISSGLYDRISISGAGKIDGDVDAEEIRVSGSARIAGRTIASRLRVSGSIVFNDDAEIGEAEISGSCRFKGNLKVKEIKSFGSLNVSGNILGEYINISGGLGVEGNVETDIIRMSGSFVIDHLLSADKVEIWLGGRCKVREIGGEQIEVRRHAWQGRGIIFEGLARLFSHREAELRCELIEGDEIYLEATHAETVRGKKIVIGKGCTIERVEYFESLEVDNSAVVRNKVQIKIGAKQNE
jgi:cytoskeletal protein CcmA (bactofilin family)